jgi:hypothetical protein
VPLERYLPGGHWVPEDEVAPTKVHTRPVPPTHTPLHAAEVRPGEAPNLPAGQAEQATAPPVL